jgi:hydrogenase maturation protease
MALSSEQEPFHGGRTPAVRVIGIGQDAAGDDAVGFHVIAALRDRVSGSDAELHSVRDPMALLDLVDGVDLAIIVDAVVGPPPGSIQVLDLEGISREPPGGFSSHGIGVGQVIALAREVLAKPPRAVKFIAMGIEQPRRYATALSPTVRAALEPAADAVLHLISRG